MVSQYLRWKTVIGRKQVFMITSKHKVIVLHLNWQYFFIIYSLANMNDYEELLFTKLLGSYKISLRTFSNISKLFLLKICCFLPFEFDDLMLQLTTWSRPLNLSKYYCSSTPKTICVHKCLGFFCYFWRKCVYKFCWEISPFKV